MKVIGFEPKFWYLLQQGDDFYIDVNCSYSFMGYGRLIKLNGSELKNFNTRGKLAIRELAEDIQYFGLDSKYLERHIEGEINELVNNTIKEFNTKNNR